MATKVLIDDMLTDEELEALREDNEKDSGDKADTASSDDKEPGKDADTEETAGTGETSEDEEAEEDEAEEAEEAEESDEGTESDESVDEELKDADGSDDEDAEADDSEDTAGSVADDVEAATLFEVAEPQVAIAVPPVEEIESREDRIAEINGLLEDLTKKVEEGELELADYTREYHKLNMELNKINTEVAVMRSQAEQSEKAIAAQWQADARAFIKANPVFDKKSNPALFGALDANIQAIANEEGVENMSNQDILREAARRVHKQLSSIMPKDAAKADTSTKGNEAVSRKTETKQAKKKQVTAARKKKTLADAPAAAQNTNNGEFAYLDKLEGTALEEALAKLSPQQLEKYLAAS